MIKEKEEIQRLAEIVNNNFKRYFNILSESHNFNIVDIDSLRIAKKEYIESKNRLEDEIDNFYKGIINVKNEPI